jgi:hypothetical protein
MSAVCSKFAFPSCGHGVVNWQDYPINCETAKTKKQEKSK